MPDTFQKSGSETSPLPDGASFLSSGMGSLSDSNALTDEGEHAARGQHGGKAEYEHEQGQRYSFSHFAFSLFR